MKQLYAPHTLQFVGGAYLYYLTEQIVMYEEWMYAFFRRFYTFLVRGDRTSTLCYAT